MSLAIDLKTASTEQYAAQLLLILLREQNSDRMSGYPGSLLPSILEFEFTPHADRAASVTSRGMRGGWVEITGSVSPPDWLREKFYEGVHWLQQKGYIRQVRGQRSDEVVQPTPEGKRAVIDQTTMTFVMPRNWTHWQSRYAESVFLLSIRLPTGDLAAGTAFLVRPRLFATCAHNVAGEMSVYLGGHETPVLNPICHDLIDVAVFSVADGIAIPGHPLPVRGSLPDVAEEVAALGYPTVPRRLPTLNILLGAVESLPTDYKQTQRFIQVGFTTSGGLSGGPVIDQCGRVVGVVSERTYEVVARAAVEKVADGVAPAKAFSQVVPISYLKDIAG